MYLSFVAWLQYFYIDTNYDIIVLLSFEIGIGSLFQSGKPVKVIIPQTPFNLL